MIKKHSISLNYRIIALFLAVLMLLTSIRVVSFLIPTVAAVDSNVKIRDDALHFVIRHWHMAEDSDAEIQGGEGGQWDPEAKEFFVIAEGYIMPADNGDGYKCYAVSQDGNNTLIPIENVEDSLYVDRFEPSTGVLYLNKKPITDDKTGKTLEDYTGLSISAGHSAIKEDGNNIVIEYDPYVHLVKAHVFYNPTGKKVRGVKKEEWKYFDDTDLCNDTKNEVDTIWVYTYINDEGSNKAGDIYLNNEKVVEPGDLPEGIDTSNLQLTKFYSSAEGLHTDNTVIAVGEDGRTFTVDLEAWYNEGYAPQVGFALDASGSMVFALDDPKQITVDSDFIAKNNIKQVTSNPGNDWESYFLTDEQLNKILNPSNTDNSTLSASDYSYFVQNSNNYEPLGYWEGVTTSYQFKARGHDIMFGWPNDWHGAIASNSTSDGQYSLASANGFQTSGTNGSTAGLLLDATPTSGSFTISFDVRQNGGTDPAANQMKIAELLYIGSMSGDTSTGGYYRLFRGETSNSAKLRANDNASTDGTLTDIDGIFGTNGKSYRITLVFDDSKVTSYQGGTVSGESKTFTFENENDIRIILNGIQDSYNGANLYIDDIYVFDKALSADEISSIGNVNATDAPADWANDNDLIGKYMFENNSNTAPSSTEAPGNGRTWLKNDVPNAAVGTSSVKTDSDLTGYASIKIRQADRISLSGDAPKVATTSNGDILGSINILSGNTKEQDVVLNHTQAGWYHISHAGEYLNHYLDIGTGKRLFGVAGTQNQSATDINGYKYTAKEDLPTRFYVDSNGNLCCFFGSGTGSSGLSSSYVYELADKDYIRTEGLQRILGSFTNKLNQKSPSAKVSAVRYSTSKITDDRLNELILLDWTSDPKEMANIMSLNRGDGTVYGSTTSANGIKQYNYGITGGTNTASGLQSYWENLKDGVDQENPYKYFIIFTDGANDGDVDDAVKYADLLKEAGYTIYAVALISETDSSKKDAETFLSQLIGNKNSNDPNEYLFFADDMTSLTNEFQTILDDIAIDLGEYTVTNYIDPRFDLVGYDDSVWHLYADGKVEVVDKTSGSVTDTYDLSNGKSVEFTLSGETTTSASKPELKYDSAKDKDMYYLEWTEQTIPPSPENADIIEVWNAEYKIKAKDDFIGGNAILTNGNKEEMNWVRCPDDTDASSGTDDMKRKYANDENEEEEEDLYPSKGFPRTTVNVKLLPINTNPLDGVIYMGEAVSPEQILTEIKDAYMTETYYLEYLKRFAYARYDVGEYHPDLKEQMDRPLLDLLTEWLEIGNDDEEVKAFSVPYMYLPAVEWDEKSGKILLDEDGKAKTIYNNTGDVETNQRCIVGVLTYRWEQLDPTPKDNYEPIKDYVKTDTERVTYSLTVEFTPLRVGDSYELFYGTDEDNDESEDEEILTTAEGYPIVTVAGIDGTDDSIITYAETSKSPFEKYLRIDDEHKGIVDSTTRLDREKYINGNPEGDHRGSYALISDADYKWNKNHKPAVGTEELIDVSKLSEGEEYPYGDALLINNYGTEEDPDYRTLKAISTYTADVVSGGIALEFKMLIGELEEAAEANGGSFVKEFTLNATRSFRDTEIVENLKEEKYTGADEDHPEWEDYGKDFEITFQFDYDQEKIADLKTEVLDNPDKYPDGYVTISAIATSITSKNHNFTDTTKGEDFTELPIGTYDFELDKINETVIEAIDNKLLFATAEDDQDGKFDKAYFDQLVRNGLHTKNEKAGDEEKWREKRDENGKIIYDEKGNVSGYYSKPEIKNKNITDFKAEANTAANKKTVSFYIGTVAKDPDASGEYVPVRGKVVDNPFDPTRYTNKRLGMLLLSTGTTLLTVNENGGKSNESFLYHITGKTKGYVDVDLIISVTGDGSTTVEIMPGDYEVKEISDWSWRYKNKATEGDENEEWDISNNLKNAKTSLRYREDSEDPVEKYKHKTVTYFHERNDKVWLGGENHEDNKFSGIVTSDEEATTSEATTSAEE